MQKLIFSDGVEFFASDFTFWSDAIQAGFVDRTKLWGGAGGVWTGGVVASAGGLVVSVSGPFKGHANGELIQVTTPANLTLANNNTNYVIATYAQTDGTPATYYGAGAPPNKRRSDTPTITSRTSGPAILGNGEIDLATVVTAAGAIVGSPTDTRIILPQVDASGNLVMGALKTVDGVDVSAHAAFIGTGATAGHLKLGALGGAARFEVAGGYWIVSRYVFNRANTFVPNETDFSAPPGGVTVDTFRVPTVDGTFDFHAFGPEYNLRAELNFSSSATFTVNARIEAFDDGIRIKDSTGLDVFSNGTASQNANQTVTMQVNTGANQWLIYGANGGGNEMITQLLTDILRNGNVTFAAL
jgi:hypothetical protein